jgi:GGDEF domain-containing protein
MFATAKKYLRELRKRQNDPYGWPDYITGLPGKSSILKRLEKVYPRLGAYGVAYVRISNIHPYLLKYGYESHAELIEWAAALLKTAADKFKDAFVGAINTHDFIVIGKSKDLEAAINAAQEAFRTRVRRYYSPQDRKKGFVLSFGTENKGVANIGLMDLIYCAHKTKTSLPKADLLARLSKECSEKESHPFR